MKHPGDAEFLTIHPNGAISHGWIVAENVAWNIKYHREFQKDCGVFMDDILIQQGTKFSVEELEQINKEQHEKWGY